MLHVSKISKSFGPDTLLTDVSFVINHGERVGLVGPNGCGKTTLMRILAGLDEADGGQMRFDPANLELGYLPQALLFGEDETVDDALASSLTEHRRAWADMEHYAASMADTSDQAQLAELTTAYAAAEVRFEAAGGYELETRLAIILAGLDLADVPRDLLVQYLSGGQKTRLGLAKLLIRQPRLLLLDEPTNHLDIDALAWLEMWLSDYDGAVLIVSHDRTFLDATTTRTLVINPITHKVRDVAGNYSAYLETLAHEIDQQTQAYQDQQQEIVHLRRTAQRLRQQAKKRKGGKGDSGDKFAKGFFANRSAGTVARAKQIEKRLAQLQSEDRIDKPGRQWGLKVDFAEDDSGARQVLSLENLAMGFDNTLLFRQVNLTLRHGQRVALIGPNGQGKTTLLRLITGELKPSAGQVHLGKGVKLGYMAQEQELLDPNSSPYDTIQEVVAGKKAMTQGQIRQFLHQFLFSGDEVFIKVGHLSYGERARLMLALLVAQDCNFLLMDEPINHLDIPSREHFEQALSHFPGTMLAVVHDRMFIKRIATDVWELRNGTLTWLPDAEIES